MDGSLISICIAGLAAGSVHVWSGMDHLAALAPLSFGKGPKAAVTGAAWGMGHSAGVVAVALLAVALKSVFDVEGFSSIAERLVGVVLVAIGIWGIRQALRMNLHVHDHVHDGEVHAHLHSHVIEAHEPGPAVSHHHTHAAVAVGSLHGFAGAGHFLALLPALGMATLFQSCSYLAAFAVGTVVSMGAFAALVGYGSIKAEGRTAQRLMIGAASVSIAVGLAWLTLPLAGWWLP